LAERFGSTKAFGFSRLTGDRH